MTTEKERRGIQSVEIGTTLLIALANAGRALQLKDVAKAAGITIGKAHPYMVSFTKVGLMSQTSSGLYEIGPLALELGLVRLQRLDPLKEAGPLVEILANETDMSVALTVWGNHGPTVVKLEQPVQPLHMALRVGTVMSLTNTATGRLFAAYLPSSKIEAVAKQDLQRYGESVETRVEDISLALKKIRADGISITRGAPLPGVSAIAAPVLGSSGQIELGVTLIGPSALFESAGDETLFKRIRQCAREISLRLGCPHSLYL